MFKISQTTKTIIITPKQQKPYQAHENMQKVTRKQNERTKSIQIPLKFIYNATKQRKPHQNVLKHSKTKTNDEPIKILEKTTKDQKTHLKL